MNVQQKADAATGLTAVSSIGGLVQWFNGWVSEFMPLFTLAGIVIGLLLSWWYYRSSLKQKERHHKEEIEIEKDSEDPPLGG